MICREDLIEIGVFNKPHGINGEISATFDYDVETVLTQDCFISDINGIFVPFFTENIRTKNNSTLLLKIDGLDDDTSVKMLVNKKVYALKKRFSVVVEALTDDDELPLDYFIGFNIIDVKGNNLGEVIDVDCSTENYLFIVKTGENTVLIPATEDFITDIDIDGKMLTMSLPEGILEI